MISTVGKNIVVYDLEIKKPIEECSKGWRSLDEMGISVGCSYDYREGKFHVYMDDNLFDLVDRLNEPDTLIVAFNHIGFDNELLRASGYNLKKDSELNNYDMLVESKAALNADKYAKGFKLDDHLKALGLPMKTADGATAPIWWQEGKFGRVIDYCLNDVMQEKALFDYIMIFGMCACAYQPKAYPIRVPEMFMDEVDGVN